VFLPGADRKLIELGAEVGVANLGFQLTCDLPEKLPLSYVAAVGMAQRLNGEEVRACFGEFGRVAEVVDGDTLKVEINGAISTVRFACVDTP